MHHIYLLTTTSRESTMQTHTCLNHHTTKRQWSRVGDDEVLVELGKPEASPVKKWKVGPENKGKRKEKNPFSVPLPQGWGLEWWTFGRGC